MQRPRVFAMTSSYHSSICVRGLSTRENCSDTEGAVVEEEDMDLGGGMDGWMGRIVSQLLM
jgi:hypothetical protein